MKNPWVYSAIRKTAQKLPDIEVALPMIFGQCGEDVIVASLLRGFSTNSGLPLPDMGYLEIGANHAIATSSTYLLHITFGMRGVLVEANPDLVADLAAGRPHDTILNRAVTDNAEPEVKFYVSNQSELSSLDAGFVLEWQQGSVGIKKEVLVKTIGINEIFENYFVGRSMALLSIDVEGMDFEILSSVDWDKWRPVIVQVEPSDHFKPSNSTNIIELMTGVGYILVARTDVNLIFCDTYNFAVAAPATGHSPASPLAVVDLNLPQPHPSGALDRPRLMDLLVVWKSLPKQLRNRSVVNNLFAGTLHWMRAFLDNPKSIATGYMARRITKTGKMRNQRNMASCTGGGNAQHK